VLLLLLLLLGLQVPFFKVPARVVEGAELDGDAGADAD
jgi:hypothetical protein